MCFLTLVLTLIFHSCTPQPPVCERLHLVAPPTILFPNHCHPARHICNAEDSHNTDQLSDISNPDEMKAK